VSVEFRVEKLKDIINATAKNFEQGVDILYRLLFIVFSFFMDIKYNGITRTLLKLFLDKMKTAVT